MEIIKNQVFKNYGNTESKLGLADISKDSLIGKVGRQAREKQARHHQRPRRAKSQCGWPSIIRYLRQWLILQDLVPNSQCRTSGPLTLPTSPPQIFHGVSMGYGTCAHLRGPSSYHPRPLPWPPLYSGLLGLGSLESAGAAVLVGTTASAAEFHASQSHCISATPPDSCKTVLPRRAPRLPLPLPLHLL